MKVKKSGSYEEVLYIFMNLIGTNALPPLKIMKIFSTKRNIPFSTAKPFETEIGLKAGHCTAWFECIKYDLDLL